MAELDDTAGASSVTFDVEETAVLRRLAGEMRALLSTEAATDPVVGRLFPDAYEDPEDAQAYRDLVGDELRAGKLRALDRVELDLGHGGGATVTLGDDSIDAWLTSLTDMRLALGTRLEITEETMGAEIDEHDPQAPAIALLHWLGWVQEAFLRGIGAVS
jgi:Domain of unknown function (DUF2017)